jgi:hypothetical protein
MTGNGTCDMRLLLLALSPLIGALAAPALVRAQSTTTASPSEVDTAPTAAQALTPLRVVPRAHVAVDRTTVPVPPTLEIEVLDPNVDPLGNPAVITRPAPGGLAVEIPPVVLVHRYYYTGDRTFQGPLLPGGPSIIVVNDPTTGVRLYLQVQMLPGAPTVTYSRHSITYDYGPQAITLKFKHHDKTEITYTEGVAFTERVRRSSEHYKQGVRTLVDRSGLPMASSFARKAVKNVALTTVDRVHDAAKLVAGPIVKLVQSTPLGSAFTQSPEQLAERQRDQAVQRARAEALKQNVDIPNLR